MAAAVPRLFDQRDFTLAVIGYVIMRVTLGAQWIRVAVDDAPRCTSARWRTPRPSRRWNRSDRDGARPHSDAEERPRPACATTARSVDWMVWREGSNAK
jgi:hypothetical protein